MASKKPPPPKNIDILGNTWTARHMAKALVEIEKSNVQVRMWNEGLTPVSSLPLSDSYPKMMLVPDFLKGHKGLGFRISVDQVYIHHRKRHREPWTSPQTTAAGLGCCPEVIALLHDLIYFNSYGAALLTGQRLKGINYEWHERYHSPNASRYTPTATVLAAKPSIERVWDSALEHQGAQINFASTMRVESVRSPESIAGMALIMSPPNGIQNDTNHVVLTSLSASASAERYSGPWMWKSYRCIVARELIASMPAFFVWIDEKPGDDFLETGLIYDGAILRVSTVALPHSDDKILVQVDRLSLIESANEIRPKDFFVGSAWYALQQQNWEPLPPSLPDDLIYGPQTSVEEAVDKVLKMPISILGSAPSGLSHHDIENASSSKVAPREVSR